MSNRTDLMSALGNLFAVASPHLQGDPVVVPTGMTAMSTAHDAELIGHPLASQLLGFQRAGVAFALKARRAMIAHDMGLGKTVQAIACLMADGQYPALVVCPPNLALNWEREFTKWAPSMTVGRLSGQTPHAFPDTDVWIIGDSVLSHWQDAIIEAAPRAFIVDESQRMKNRTALRTKAAQEITRKMSHDALVLLLTGTAVKNDPGELLSQLVILGVEDHFGGIMGYMDRYYPKVDKYAREAANSSELFDRMSDSFYARLLFEDVKYQFEALGMLVPGLPRRTPVPTEMAGKAGKDYSQARDDLRSFLVATRGERNADKAMRAEALTRLGVLRKLIGLAKVPATVEFIQELVDDGEKVIVFAWHRDVVDGVVEALAKSKIDAGKIYGGISVEKVEADKARFQDGDLPVMVLNIEAGSTGHTLTAARNVVFIEYAWNPADMAQAEARANRIGQERTVLSHWMVGANGQSTVDERFVEIINDKAKLTGATLNGVGHAMVDHESMTQALLDWAEFG
jgi:SWI/SNF-related matrix-associated actin-dependent regulator 1 of chromatin subfamily A